jgi:hypothetical protein
MTKPALFSLLVCAACLMALATANLAKTTPVPPMAAAAAQVDVAAIRADAEYRARLLARGENPMWNDGQRACETTLLGPPPCWEVHQIYAAGRFAWSGPFFSRAAADSLKGDLLQRQREGWFPGVTRTIVVEYHSTGKGVESSK